jgi:Protein of unknown function (DUF2934)
MLRITRMPLLDPPASRHACRQPRRLFAARRPHGSGNARLVGVQILALASGLCQTVRMAEKRTKADRLERQTEQLGKRVDRHPDEIEKEKATREDVNRVPAQTTRAPDAPTLLIPIEQQIQQRAYELYEQRGRTEGYDSDNWLQAEYEIKGTQANAA